VTEAEWLACADPKPMLEFLRGKVSERKLRLFALACCGRIDSQISDPRSRAALAFTAIHVESGLARRRGRPAVAEAADAAKKELYARYYPRSNPDTLEADVAAFSAAEAALATLKVDPWFAAGYASCFASYARGSFFEGGEREQQAWLLRDIFANPFHPLPPLAPAVLAWNERTVPRLAQVAYDEQHLPEGTLDTGRLAILADALLDAGCDDEGLMSHLRGPGPHVRGCWSLDLIFGKK
jgi:hypothetical protein